ncbi:hypothetical protein GCK32_015096 [Trichostrongylus colubriformis]|uniref:G-protein coupled receptors family 1 profile domain-containing protein n=1 Tax=Trichostrongylus colubriformis TaxID=6319 RepID=A0AAN8EM70_TRICO
MASSEISFPVGYQLYYIIIPTMSIVGNGSIVYVTLRSKRLRSPCNILISFTSFGEFLHMFTHFIAVVSFNINRDHMIFHDICVYLQLPSVFGMLMSSMILLNIALDRLFSLTKIYKKFIGFHTKLYITAQTFPALLFAATMCFYSFLLRATNDGNGQFRWYETLLKNTPSDSLLDIKRNRTDTVRSTHRSLMVIAVTTVFGWFSTMLVAWAGHVLSFNNAGLLAGLFINATSSMNLFVYYYMSTQYRRILDKYLLIGKIKRLLGGTEYSVSRIFTRT